MWTPVAARNAEYRLRRQVEIDISIIAIQTKERYPVGVSWRLDNITVILLINILASEYLAIFLRGLRVTEH